MTGERPAFYAYVVVDTGATPAEPIAVVFTRADARLLIRNMTPLGARSLRIRRAKVVLYES